MAGVFDDDIATAQELIAEFGQDCWWQKPSVATGSGVPGYPGAQGPLPDPIPCKIAFFSQRDLNRGTGEFLGMVQGTEVPDNAEIGLLAGGIAFEPENVDTIRRGSAIAERISIKAIDRLAPNGTPVLYYITVEA